MLKWYLLSEIRVIYIRKSEGGADRQTNRHTNNINWGSVNSAVGPFEAFSLEFALGLEVTMWLSAVSFCSSSSAPIGILLHGIQICWLTHSGTLHSLLRERAEVQTCPSLHSYVQNIDQSRHSLHVWGFSHSKCDHVSGVPGCWNSGCGQC